MTKKIVFTLLRLAVGVGLLGLIFFKVGLIPIWDALRTAHLGYFALAFFLFLVSVLIAAVNIFIMVRPFYAVPFSAMLNYFLISNRIASLFLPGRLGEYSITLLLKKGHHVPIGVSAAAVTIDKVITLIISCVIGVVGLFSFFGQSLALRAAGFALLFCAVIVFCFLPWSRRFIRTRILGKYASHLSGFYTTFSSYWREHRAALLFNTVVTLIRVVVIALSAFFMFAAVGVFPSVLVIIAIGGVETISTILPVTFNGLGVKQSVGVYLYYLAGVDPALTAARYVLGFVINYGFALVSLLLVKNPVEGEHENFD